MDNTFTIFTWKITDGLRPLDGSRQTAVKAVSLDDALKYIVGTDSEARRDNLYLMYNVREFLKSSALMQRLRDAAYKVRTCESYMILIGGQYDVPEELDDVITFVDLELPKREEIQRIFKAVADRYTDVMTEKPDAEALLAAADNALCLTEFKTDSAVSLSIVSSSRVDISLIRKEKRLAVKQSGVLEYIPHTETADTLGGFGVLKEHVSKRRNIVVRLICES
ncbi:MAG: hypothetical protein LBQ51_03350 [Desulfovibrio sp.]|nr:hypothetical protein [Desulfovibrio sp.]